MPPQLVNWCDERMATPLGSTRFDDEVRDFSEKPLFSQDATDNPTFHDWHVVFFRYCDGASFASKAGYSNFQAILHELVVGGFGNAAKVVVSGCSAGALA